MDRLSEIRARCDAATPGPWEEKTNCHPQCNGEPWGWISRASGNITWSGNAGKNNASFIAHARDDVPYLLARLEKAEAALSDMRFAYVNKDPDVPHAFEVDAMNTAAGILGEWPPKKGE